MRTPPAALRTFLAAYDTAIARLFFATRKAVLAAAPQANELIYDAYNAVSVAYSFSERLQEAFCHVAAYRAYVNLGFNHGADLADPMELLVGTGTSIRHLRIAAVGDPQRPEVQRLVRAAVEQGRQLCPVAPTKPQSIVKAVYENKRRPAPAKR